MLIGVVEGSGFCVFSAFLWDCMSFFGEPGLEKSIGWCYLNIACCWVFCNVVGSFGFE